MLTNDSIESAGTMRQGIVDNADARNEVGIELLGVRVLAVLASTSVGE